MFLVVDTLYFRFATILSDTCINVVDYFDGAWTFQALNYIEHVKSNVIHR